MDENFPEYEGNIVHIEAIVNAEGGEETLFYTAKPASFTTNYEGLKKAVVELKAKDQESLDEFLGRETCPLTKRIFPMRLDLAIEGANIRVKEEQYTSPNLNPGGLHSYVLEVMDGKHAGLEYRHVVSYD
jgi:hypothetical protein